MEDNYKGYRIRAHPRQYVETEKWGSHFTIDHDTGDTVQTYQYTGNETFENKEDAIRNCFRLGRQIIDDGKLA